MRPIRVVQKENDTGDFWYAILGGNGEPMLHSEMYPTRSNALRAAKRFIAMVDPAPVSFTYWKVNRPGSGRLLTTVVAVTERIRWRT